MISIIIGYNSSKRYLFIPLLTHGFQQNVLDIHLIENKEKSKDQRSV